MSTTPYAEQFQAANLAAHYESSEYAANSYSSFMWALQKPVLFQWLKQFQDANGAAKLLDFACGTGRILSVVEDKVASSDGVDISEEMTMLAKEKCGSSKISVGNIVTNPDLANADYDIVTSFRFLLNTDPVTREQVLIELRKRLANSKGALIVNVHGNRNSLRHWALKYRHIAHSENHSEMSPAEIKALFERTGFEIIECVGFGIMPPTLYRTPLKWVAKIIDRLGLKIPFLTRISIDLLYRCKPSRSS